MLSGLVALAGTYSGAPPPFVAQGTKWPASIDLGPSRFDPDDVVVIESPAPTAAPIELEPLPDDALARREAEFAKVLPELGRASIARDLTTIARMRRLLGLRQASALLRGLRELRDVGVERPDGWSSTAGFGLETRGWRIGGHAAWCNVSVTAWQDEVVEVSIACSTSSWSGRTERLALLERELGSSFRPRAGQPNVLDTRFRFADALAHADAARAKVLGAPREVDVPESLGRAYKALTSRDAIVTVGESCGLVATTTVGAIATELLVTAGRRDLLGNALRGPNPGGRAHGALGLLALPPLVPADREAIEALRREPHDVSLSCFGSSAVADQVPRPTPEAVALVQERFASRARCGAPNLVRAEPENDDGVQPLDPSFAPTPRFERRSPREESPTSFVMDASVDLTGNELLHQYAAALWGLTAADELRPEPRGIMANGYTARRYRQLHAGYPVVAGRFAEPAGIWLESCGGRVHAGWARLVGGLHVDVRVRIPEDAARRRAVEHFARDGGAPLESFETPGEPAGDLVIERHRRLVWRFVLTSRKATRVILVDAGTGAVFSGED